MGYSRTTRFRRQLLAGWKFILSFRKREWALEDYPVFTFRQKSEQEETPKFGAVPRYRADAVNWIGLCGTGDTPTDALKDLAKTFDIRRKNRGPMPRPGRVVPIEFASRGRIDAQPALAEDFTHNVLELDWAWISDESSLLEFGGEESLEPYYEKVRSRYGVDVSDIANGNLAEILERITITKQQNG